MFYIVNENSDFVRSGRRGEPQTLCFSDARDYADKFKTQAEANKMLAYWQYNNDFKGRVINYRESCAIVVYAE